jgi:antitoxin PrlF
MQSAIVSPQGQVLIPTEIRQQLGITPCSRLDFTVEGSTFRIQIDLSKKQSRPEDGYGMHVCKKPEQGNCLISTLQSRRVRIAHLSRGSVVHDAHLCKACQTGLFLPHERFQCRRQDWCHKQHARQLVCRICRRLSRRGLGRTSFG